MLTLSPRRIPGLSALAKDYDAILCDVWGVIHNGVAAFPGAVEALRAYRAGGGRVVLLTNAPRPAEPIHDQLAKLGVPADAYDDLLTSGDVTREILMARPERAVLHVGPHRDLALYEGLPIELVDDTRAEAVVATGLYDDNVETPEDYRARLASLAERRLPMICANPDIVVKRGTKRVWCAGALARVFEEYGGEAVLVGKPYPPVYEEARLRLAAVCGRPFDRLRVLAIGDGLATDVRGAYGQKLDVLFVTSGIHGADFGPLDDPDPKRVEIRLMDEDLAVTAMVSRLVW
ncbi:MAG: TIGR01459 family HAD-type hydrolase [Phyllobacteriaceae bacterium]|nr:TIGR01459 family HAD-type hydrolase [Phyllobacteriaceae bacterium]